VDLKELKGTSFAIPERTRPRLIVSATGQEKMGKSHFALTGPGPIAYMSTDIGHEGVVDKFMNDKKVFVAEYALPEVKKGNADKAMAQAKEVWEQFVHDYEIALTKFRTVVLDTATEFWELLRIYRFGKLTQVMPMQYGPVNQEYKELIRSAYSEGANVILLHKSKAVWAEKMDGKSYKTGRFERSGFADTGFLVQVNISLTRLNRNDRDEEDPSDDGFRMEVVDCRQNANLAGEVLRAPMNTFPMLAQLVLPDSQPSDWE
jgi:hypothetical protein